MLMGVLVLLLFAGFLALAAIVTGVLELVSFARIKRSGAEASAVCQGHIWGSVGKSYRLEFTDSRGGVNTIWTSRYCEAGRTYTVLYDTARPKRSVLAPVNVWDPTRPRQVVMIAGCAGLVVLTLIALVMQ
ncbi:DUF3592 domain-containing protein [Streptomyces sp. CFMR 7]|uniref:DUF3592 domain-containing protein n=1 Tax=Streptomyces sp. CFMR 7 TaxID=1649184 RepID=UPI0011A6CC45|nr:DUF3592 domain-containing protein [Streptomyces sp. CFMR 7]